MSQMVMYLFGDRNPEIAALLGEQRFRHLVSALFPAGEAAFPVDPPPLLQEAVHLDLLDSDGSGYRAGKRLVLVPTEAERGVADLLKPVLERYVEVTGEVEDELREVYGQTTVAERFTWSQVSHSILAGLFLDLAMGLEALRIGSISREPTGDTVIWAFQGIMAENAYGVSVIPSASPDRLVFIELWHRRTRRIPPRISPSHVRTLSMIAKGERAEGDPKVLLYLKHLKLVRSVGRELFLQIPSFGTADTEKLLGPLTEGARRLVAQAIAPALEILGRHAWWSERILQEPYRHAAIRLMLEYGIDHVVSAGICPPFPEEQEASVEWGRWLWEEPEGPRTIIPHQASGRGEDLAG